MSYRFGKLTFEKTGREIKDKIAAKVDSLENKVEARKKIIADQAKALGISSVEEALTRAEEIGISLSDENRVVHSKMLSNTSRVKDESREIRQLKMAHRNLDDKRTFELDFDSLEYYGF